MGKEVQPSRQSSEHPGRIARAFGYVSEVAALLAAVVTGSFAIKLQESAAIKGLIATVGLLGIGAVSHHAANRRAARH